MDFLNREPDEVGSNFWSDQIIGCGSDLTYRSEKSKCFGSLLSLNRVQETGGLVDSLYRASYSRRPLYNEFVPDTQTVGHNVIVESAVGNSS
jgi:hypothetical protein